MAEVLLAIAVLWLLAALGNALNADKLLTRHAESALRLGALHVDSMDLLHAWRRARRNSTYCFNWCAVFLVLSLAVGSLR